MTEDASAARTGEVVRRVLLTVHTGRRDIVELAQQAAARLQKAGIVIRVLEDEAEALDIDGAEIVPADAQAAIDSEIIMVYGGDGTFLRAAELARNTDAALMGVNLGHVGFLAETEPEAVEETLAAIERCDYSVENRLALSVDVLDAAGDVIGGTWALNEVSIEKAERSRVLDVVIAIDGRPLTSFGCDGVLCATPTGSTAYAFSAGGPIIWPDVEALLLVPSNAHALFARPLVTSPKSVLTIAVPADGNTARVSADGRRFVEIPDGGRVDVRKATDPVRIARVHKSTFGDRLVTKFGLPVRGFREFRHHAGPGHELLTSRNVLSRDIVNADGVTLGSTAEPDGQLTDGQLTDGQLTDGEPTADEPTDDEEPMGEDTVAGTHPDD
jgi:NAD+ kinase